MKFRNLVIVFSFLFVCSLFMGLTAAEASQSPPYKVQGTVSVNGVTITAADTSFVITAKDASLQDITAGTTDASYTMGSNEALGDLYRLQFDVADSAFPNGEIHIYVNGVEINEGTITTSADLYGTLLTQNITATISGASLSATSGSEQSATVGTALSNPFVVTVLDSGGKPAPGASVTFAVASGGGSTTPTTATTDAVGQASTTLTLGETAGTNTVTASVSGLDAVTFTATGTAGAANKLVIAATPTTLASNQLGTATVTATITDQYGNTVDDDATQVTFAFTDYTYLTLAASATVTAVDGEAKLTVTTATGNVDVSPSTTDVSITSSPVLTPPSSVTLNIVNFSATPQDVALVTSGTPHQTTITAIGATNYTWSITSGNGVLSATSGETVTFTAPTSITEGTTGHQTQIQVQDTDNPEVTFGLTLTTYEPVTITNKLSEAVTLESGATSATYTVAGGGDTYTWELKDSSGTVIDTATGASYSFAAPSTGAFAGVYTVTVTDNKEFTDSFEVKIPIALTPNSKVFTETKLDGSANPQDFTVTGASSDYTWEILDSETATAEVATPADYGTWSNSTATEIFTPANVTAIKKFYIRVTITKDADLTESNGLNKRVFGPFTLIPVGTFTVTVSDSAGVAIEGATVSVDYIDPNTSSQVADQTTDADGQTTFTLPDAGGTFAYTVIATDYVNRETSSTAKAVAVTLEGIGDDTITGIVEDTTGTAKAGATVAAFQPSDVATQYQATTAGDGTYTINLPVGAPQSGWTVVAGLTGFVSKSQADQAVGVVDFTTTNGLQAKTTITSVTATVVGTTVQLDITANPAFTAASEADVSLIEGNGTLAAATFAGGTVSIIYDTVEDFTVVIKADTSEDNDPAVGYFASRAFSYVAADTATATGQVDIETGGSGTQTVTADAQSADVEVPIGGLEKDATIVIKQVPKTTTATTTQASPTYVYEVTATDSSTGLELAAGDISRIEITLPIDLSVISPGDLENGIFVIYHADSLATLEAGGGTVVSTSNIIGTDYIGDGSIGSVTFWVDHLSVFGIGGGAAGGGGGDDNNCFIATAAYGSPFEAHVETLRKFRDVYLLPTKLGHAFVEAYYRHAPPIAEFIADHEFMRTMVRWCLAPVVGMSWLALQIGMMPVLLFIFFFMGIGAAFFYIRRTPRSDRA